MSARPAQAFRGSIHALRTRAHLLCLKFSMRGVETQLFRTESRMLWKATIHDYNNAGKAAVRTAARRASDLL